MEKKTPGVIPFVSEVQLYMYSCKACGQLQLCPDFEKFAHILQYGLKAFNFIVKNLEGE